MSHPETKDDEKSKLLLVKYQKAQDSAQFHDQLVWASTAITWALSGVMLNFAFTNVRKPVLSTFVAVVGIVVLYFQWAVQDGLRSVKNQKYARCKKIEAQLGTMRQHTDLKFSAGRQTSAYRAIITSIGIGWLAIVYQAWWGTSSTFLD